MSSTLPLKLGIALVISPIQSSRGGLRRDFPVALAVPIITAALVFDGMVSRIDGLLLLSRFVLWLVAVMVEANGKGVIPTTLVAWLPGVP
jgi:cation:H+ antiporter